MEGAQPRSLLLGLESNKTTATCSQFFMGSNYQAGATKSNTLTMADIIRFLKLNWKCSGTPKERPGVSPLFMAIRIWFTAWRGRLTSPTVSRLSRVIEYTTMKHLFYCGSLHLLVFFPLRWPVLVRLEQHETWAAGGKTCSSRHGGAVLWLVKVRPECHCHGWCWQSDQGLGLAQHFSPYLRASCKTDIYRGMFDFIRWSLSVFRVTNTRSKECASRLTGPTYLPHARTIWPLVCGMCPFIADLPSRCLNRLRKFFRNTANLFMVS